jgi:hypothetical protein
MANTIDVSCPHCQKAIKAPTELQGKKVRCKGCGNTFPIPSAAPAKAPAAEEETDNPYTLTKVEESSLCPFCAQPLESADAVLCLNCGYNLQTRQRVQTRKIVETTSSDRFAWLLPGIICVGVILVLIVLDILYLVWEPSPKFGAPWLGHAGIKTWIVIMSLFAMFFAGRFAFKRLILHPVPPEKEK